MEDNHRHTRRWMTIDVESALHGSDRGHLIGHLARYPIRHHGAVRDARKVDALAVDGVIAFDLFKQSPQEANIVDLLFHRWTAAASRIPGRHATDAAWVNSDEIFPIRFGAHTG